MVPIADNNFFTFQLVRLSVARYGAIALNCRCFRTGTISPHGSFLTGGSFILNVNHRFGRQHFYTGSVGFGIKCTSRYLDQQNISRIGKLFHLLILRVYKIKLIDYYTVVHFRLQFASGSQEHLGIFILIKQERSRISLSSQLPQTAQCKSNKNKNPSHNTSTLSNKGLS